VVKRRAVSAFKVSFFSAVLFLSGWKPRVQAQSPLLQNPGHPFYPEYPVLLNQMQRTATLSGLPIRAGFLVSTFPGFRRR
jgi:hypothetical protein